MVTNLKRINSSLIRNESNWVKFRDIRTVGSQSPEQRCWQPTFGKKPGSADSNLYSRKEGPGFDRRDLFRACYPLCLGLIRVLSSILESKQEVGLLGNAKEKSNGLARGVLLIELHRPSSAPVTQTRNNNVIHVFLNNGRV